MAESSPVLVLNGDLQWTESLARMVREAALVLAADGGANALGRIGVRPTAVVGDLDSIESGTRSWIGEELLVHRPGQESTDFEKALAFAFEDLGLDRLIVLGALGGRLDHTVGNLGVLTREARGPDLELVTETERILATSDPLDLDARLGETLSFWTFDKAVKITVKGVRWPICDAPLTVGERPSISNEASSSTIRILPTGGTVVVCRIVGKSDIRKPSDPDSR